MDSFTELALSLNCVSVLMEKYCPSILKSTFRISSHNTRLLWATIPKLVVGLLFLFLHLLEVFSRTSSTAFLTTEKLKQNKNTAVSCLYGSPEKELMPAILRKSQRYYTANEDDCCMEKLFPWKTPWDLTWQWGTTCSHRTSSHCRAETGAIPGTDIPQGYSTPPANSFTVPGSAASLKAQFWVGHLSPAGRAASH